MPWQTQSGSGVTTLLNNIITNTSSVVSGAGGQKTFGPFSYAQGSSYIIQFLCQSGGVSASDAFNVEVTWADNLGNYIDSQGYWVCAAASSSTTPHYVTINGPAVAPQMYLTFNGWSATTVSVQAAVFQDTFVQRSVHRCRSIVRFGTSGTGSQHQDNINSIPALYTGGAATFGTPTGTPGAFNNLAICDPTAQELAFFDQQFALSSNNTWMLPMYNGPVTLAGQTLSLTSDLGINIFFAAQAVGQRFSYATTPLVQSLQSNAAGQINATFYLPNTQCAIVIFNNNAAAKNIAFTISTAD